MIDKSKLNQVFGQPDESFKNAFDTAISSLPQAGETARKARNPRKIAALALAACLLLTGTVVAIDRIFLDRADIGATWELVYAPEDYYLDAEPLVEGNNVYASAFAIYKNGAPAGELKSMSAEHAADINERLASLGVVTAGGEPAMMVQLEGTDRYAITAAEGGLFNADGEELYSIYYTTGDRISAIKLVMQTVADIEELEIQLNAGIYDLENKDTLIAKRVFDYESAVELVGGEFKLPTAYADGFDSVEFRYNGSPRDTNSPMRKAVYVTYSGEPGLSYFAELARNNEATPREWFTDGATIELCKIEGLEVYRLLSPNGYVRYTWADGDFVYMLFGDFCREGEFTDDQFVEIITSMINQ